MRFLFSLAIAVGTAVLIAVVIPFSLIAFAFWAADGSWNFEGRGIKYWVFVQGSRLERIGTIEPVGAVKYSISLGEGNFPGWNIATYESVAQPDKIIASYVERCASMKFKITENKSEQKADTIRAEMTCEIEKYLDIEIVAEREAAAANTKVFVKVWGSE